MAPKRGDRTQSFSPFPPNLGFLWSIDEVTPKVVRQFRIKGDNWKDDSATYCFPPHKKDDFTRQRKGDIFRWREGNSERTEISKGQLEKPYGVASIFFQPRQDNFLALNKDCMRQDLKKDGPGSGWCQIGFRHNGELSEVDFVGEREGLAYPAKESTLMPQVLPSVYDCFERKGEPLRGGLCGKLAILIGLAAFSASSSTSELVVQKCFKMGKWLPHRGETGIGRSDHRVVVVTIYLDPKVPNIKANILRDFEDGKYGPILATIPMPPTNSSTQAYQPTQNYTIASSGTRSLGNAAATPRMPTQHNFSSTATARSTGSGSPYTYSLPVQLTAAARGTRPQQVFGEVGPEGPRLPDDEDEDEEGK